MESYTANYKSTLIMYKPIECFVEGSSSFLLISCCSWCTDELTSLNVIVWLDFMPDWNTLAVNSIGSSTSMSLPLENTFIVKKIYKPDC